MAVGQPRRRAHPARRTDQGAGRPPWGVQGTRDRTPVDGERLEGRSPLHALDEPGRPAEADRLEQAAPVTRRQPGGGGRATLVVGTDGHLTHGAVVVEHGEGEAQLREVAAYVVVDGDRHPRALQHHRRAPRTQLRCDVGSRAARGPLRRPGRDAGQSAGVDDDPGDDGEAGLVGVRRVHPGRHQPPALRVDLVGEPDGPRQREVGGVGHRGAHLGGGGTRPPGRRGQRDPDREHRDGQRRGHGQDHQRALATATHGAGGDVRRQRATFRRPPHPQVGDTEHQEAADQPDRDREQDRQGQVGRVGRLRMAPARGDHERGDRRGDEGQPPDHQAPAGARGTSYAGDLGAQRLVDRVTDDERRDQGGHQHDGEHRDRAGGQERHRQPGHEPLAGEHPRGQVAQDHADGRGDGQDQQRLEHAEEPQLAAVVPAQGRERQLAAAQPHRGAEEPRQEDQRDQDQGQHGRLDRRPRHAAPREQLVGRLRQRVAGLEREPGQQLVVVRGLAQRCDAGGGECRVVGRELGRDAQRLVDGDEPAVAAELDPALGGDPRRQAARDQRGSNRPGAVCRRGPNQKPSSSARGV